jgi:serine/threonine-protein kinase RsbW
MNYKYKSPCCKEKLQDIRIFVNQVLTQFNLSEVEINKLVLAVDEVCANIIIHSHNCNAEDFLELCISYKENEGITFEIADRGVGFNICKYAEPNLSQIVKEKKKGGIGLILVKRIMDDIEFLRVSDQNICRLVKKISSC